MTWPILGDPAMEARFTAAFSACTEQFEVQVVACAEKVNALIALCSEASAQQDAKVTAALDVCKKSRAALQMTMQAAQRGEPRTRTGTAQREYAAAFEPAQKELAAAYLAFNTAIESISAILAGAHAIKSGLEESFDLLASVSTSE